MMMMKLPILACAKKLETQLGHFGLPHEKPRTKTDISTGLVSRGKILRNSVQSLPTSEVDSLHNVFFR